MTGLRNIVPETLHILIHIYYADTNYSRDYAKVSIIINDDLVNTYGDYYHDKILERAKGFADAVKIMFPDCIISKSEKADYVY